MTLELDDIYHEPYLYEKGDGKCYGSYKLATKQIVIYPKAHVGWRRDTVGVMAETIEHEWLHKILTEQMDVPIGVPQHLIIYSMIGTKTKGWLWGDKFIPPVIEEYLKGHSLHECFKDYYFYIGSQQHYDNV